MVGAGRAARGGAPFPDCGVALPLLKDGPPLAAAAGRQGFVGAAAKLGPRCGQTEQSQRRWDPKNKLESNL
jgi:hypothetical protein